MRGAEKRAMGWADAAALCGRYAHLHYLEVATEPNFRWRATLAPRLNRRRAQIISLRRRLHTAALWLGWGADEPTHRGYYWVGLLDCLEATVPHCSLSG